MNEYICVMRLSGKASVAIVQSAVQSIEQDGDGVIVNLNNNLCYRIPDTTLQEAIGWMFPEVVDRVKKKKKARVDA